MNLYLKELGYFTLSTGTFSANYTWKWACHSKISKFEENLSSSAMHMAGHDWLHSLRREPVFLAWSSRSTGQMLIRCHSVVCPQINMNTLESVILFFFSFHNWYPGINMSRKKLERCILVSYFCHQLGGLKNTGLLFFSSGGQKSKVGLTRLN